MKSYAAHRIKIVALLVILALSAPILFYVVTFGTSLSHNHLRWSELGTFIGGIYAPIAAFFTLAIITGQLSSQVHFNNHQMDQAFLNNSRADLPFLY
jgi:hypothetical protein